MKVILLSLFIAPSILLFGQLQDLPAEGTIYTSTAIDIEGGRPRFLSYWETDLEINDTTYTIFNQNGDSLYLREEDNKWYMRNTISYLQDYGQTEFLLYDWNAEAGDTIQCGIPQWLFNFDEPVIQSLTIDSIGSVMDELGNSRKLFYARNISTDFLNPIEWIEGFGNLSYALEHSASHSLFDSGFILVCIESSAGLVYETSVTGILPEYENCLWNNVEELENKFKIELFPNPTESSLVVKSELRISELRIFNLSSEEIYFSELNNYQTELDLAHLKSGYYFLELLSKSGGKIRQKFLKL